jgi:GH15 family glucan-1,4-alpha-glucosidase
MGRTVRQINAPEPSSVGHWSLMAYPARARAEADSPYLPIADYALIGDCHSAALISRDSSVDWFCPDRFDAPALFCRLLDASKGGYFKTAPRDAFSAQRRYIGATNVLETTFSTPSGRVRLTDVMPVARRSASRRGYDIAASGRLLRRLECLDGEVELRLELQPTFDYARAETRLEVKDSCGAVAEGAGRYLTLSSPGIHLRRSDSGALCGRVRLRSGEQRWLALTPTDDEHRAVEALTPKTGDEQLEHTLRYWQQWADQCTYRGPYRDLVLRSALILKLLTYEPSGAVLAAPTTSLPETIGGERNWDYRFTWLRDSSLILYALLTIGYSDEAADFMHWLEQTVGADPARQPQIMYGIDGREQLPEDILHHLDGYRGSRPVRIGNAAATQRQLDIYGEILRAAALHYRRGTDAPGESNAAAEHHGGHPPSPEAWRLLRGLVDRAADEWHHKGSGIWEVRGGPESFLYGKLMCWAAVNSGLRLAGDFSLQAPVEHWQRARDQMRRAILRQGYNSDLGAFTQAFGSSTLDATALVIPRIGFLPPTDPRVQSTVSRIRQRLSQHGLVYRYRTQDGLAGGEGTFTLCTYWLVDALALGGQLDEAHALFEHVTGYANDLGLLAEEIDPDTGEQLGNFPQGFSHLALIGAAVNLAKAATHGAERRPESEGDRAARASRAASATG